MVDRDIIIEKITHAKESLDRLEDKRRASRKEFLANKDLQDIILFNLQTAIQGCIDISAHIVADEGWATPETLSGLFEVLFKHKILDSNLNKKMKMMVGFRNIIVHEYANIDFKKVYSILNKDLKDINKFLKQICVFAKLS